MTDSLRSLTLGLSVVCLLSTAACGDDQNVKSSDICGQAGVLRRIVADTDSATYASNVDKWHSVIDQTTHASDAKLASFGKLVKQKDWDAANYYIPLSDIIGYACDSDAGALKSDDL